MQMAQRGTDEPTLVAGYKEWERHGRTVLKGEHALWVIAPRTARVQQMLLPDRTHQRIPLGDKLPKGAVDEGKKTLGSTAAWSASSPSLTYAKLP
jgi:hypothetical protein